MRAPLIEVSKTFEPRLSARIFVTHVSHLSVSVGNAFVAFDDSLDRRFAFRSKTSQLRTSIGDLLIDLFRFSGRSRLRRSGALPFTRQTFGLLRKFLERTLDLPREFVQPFCRNRVVQKFCT